MSDKTEVNQLQESLGIQPKKAAGLLGLDAELNCGRKARKKQLL